MHQFTNHQEKEEGLHGVQPDHQSSCYQSILWLDGIYALLCMLVHA
jgi:hypothetical protein